MRSLLRIRTYIEAPGATVAASVSGLGILEVLWFSWRQDLYGARVSQAAVMLGLALVAVSAILLLTNPSWRIRLGEIAGVELPRRLRSSLWVAVGVMGALPLAVVYGPSGHLFEPLFVRASLFWLFAMVAAALATPRLGKVRWEFRVIGALVLLTFAHRVIAFAPLISTYPLAMGWSETSRYYYGSLFLARPIYGQSVPPSVLHPSRYLLQAIPFLITRRALWFHRVWQVGLWLGLTGGTAWLLAKRSRQDRGWFGLAFAAWAFLFIIQGPVLYHLLVPVMLVLVGVRSGRPFRSLVVVLAASLWAGISRVNWIPVPGFLAASVYLLETDGKDSKWLAFLRTPALWILAGAVTGGLSQVGYIFLSGNEANQFSSSFTSDLLWYRLLPNRTFLPGILAGVLLISAPMLALAAWRRRQLREIPWFRGLPLALMLLVLGVGGIIVSVKIGGGSNLHNLDAYLILVLIVISYLVGPRTAGVHWDREHLPLPVTAVAVAVPILFALTSGASLRWPDPARGHTILQELRHELEQHDSGANVLFISERHLLTFGSIQGLALVPDYEKVFLMEMAMGNSRGYLDPFVASLESGEYDAIVSEPLKIQYQGRSRPFGEENDVWVERVSIPVLCYYEPVKTLEGAPIQILEPRPRRTECPQP